MLQGRMLIAATVYLSVAVADAERPTADAVAAAVARSRAKYAEAHPVPSKQQKLASIQKEIDDTQASMRRLTGVRAAANVDRLYKMIRSLKAELAQVRRKYTPVTMIRLTALTTGDFKVGSVGRINDEADQRPVYCVRVLEEGSMLVYMETIVATDKETSEQSGATRVVSPTFLLNGADTSAAVAEQPISGAFDVAVTGKYSYEDAEGETQSVFVLEVFDPGRPFE